jgi:hypothetical protein
MRFTIRDLLWLTVVVAMALGWLAEHRHAGIVAERCAKAEELQANTKMMLDRITNATYQEIPAKGSGT